MVKKIRILYLVLPVILLLGIYGSQSSYEKSGFFEPYKNQKSNGIMTMSIDNTSYEQGQTINVLGKVTKSSENVSVVIKIIDPTKNQVGDFHGTVNQYGIFTVFYVIPDTFQSGKYTLTAYYEGDSKKTLVSFDITISNIPSGVSYITIPYGASIEGNNLNFVPSKLVVSHGSKIIWINNDADIHTVISGKVLDSGALSLSNFFQGGFIKPGQTIDVSLNSGNYTYFCKIHPWLGGTISVKASKVTAKPAPPVTTKPTPPVTAKPAPPVIPKPAPPVIPKPAPPMTAKPAPTMPSKPPPSTTSNPSTGSDNFLSTIWKSLLGLFTGGVSSVSHGNTTESSPSQVAKPTSSPFHYHALSYWTFDDSLLVTKDQGVLGKDLIQVGKGKIVPGRIGNAINFTGTNYFKASSPSLYNFTSSTPFSVAFWVKMPAKPVEEEFIDKTVNSHGHGWNIWSYSEGKILFTFGNGTRYSEVSSTISLSDNSWQHIVCTYDGSNNSYGMKIYVNGTMNNRGYQVIDYSISNNQSLAVGAFSNGAHRLQAGTILDDLSIYGYELSARQISTLYQAP